ncbi:MAG: gliding motility-associated C-terminal domain-containing protein, partial [Flavobacteriales bacterium]|nr:gliding motility-associated C-terminal domain-containing protein [Flavobacteriales bacterium]
NPTADFSANIQDFCLPAVVEFNNLSTSISNQAVVQWNFHDFTDIVVDTAKTVIHEYQEPGIYDVSISITDINGCSATDTALKYINILPPVTADFTSDPPNGLTTTRNKARFFNLSFGADAYSWKIDGLKIDSTFNMNYAFPQETAEVYEICLEARSILTGCADTICKMMEVLEVSSIFIPNGFTPNGDGINDEFGAVGRGISAEDFSFQIFNRWGDLLFTSTKLNDHWDGRFNGTLVQDGIYSYKLVYRLEDNKRIQTEVGEVYMLK